jgi:tRNA(Glu) U13 pseudouridine synthase TruD
MEGLKVEHAPGGLIVRMTLPRGAYATTVLGQVAELVQPRGGPPAPGDAEPEDAPGDAP